MRAATSLSYPSLATWAGVTGPSGRLIVPPYLLAWISHRPNRPLLASRRDGSRTLFMCRLLLEHHAGGRWQSPRSDFLHRQGQVHQ